MISKEEVKKIASLAQLEFKNEVIEDLALELTNIIEMMDGLNVVDCSNVVPLKSVNNISQRFVADKITVKDNSNELFNNAPEPYSDLAKEIKCFIVPKVIE